MVEIAIAAPVEPIDILCIQKTLGVGIKGDLVVGLGAALVDSVYGLMAAIGLIAVSHIIIAGTGALKLRE